MIRTHRNGGKSSLDEVAAAWKIEGHDFHWSESPADRHAVELAKKILAEELKEGPVHPDPRNTH